MIAEAVGNAVDAEIADENRLAGKVTLRGPCLIGAPRKAYKQEIDHAVVDFEADAPQPLGEPRQPALVVFKGALEMILVIERGGRRGLCKAVHVEGTADPVKRIDDGRRSVEPADPQSGKRIALRKGPGHDGVGAVVDQFGAGTVVVPADELGIGRIDHQKNVIRQTGAKLRDVASRNVASGRIVGVGEENKLRLLRDCGQHGVDVHPEVLFRSGDRCGTGCARCDRIDGETVPAEENLVARTGIDPRQQLEDLVGTVAAHDPRRIEVPAPPDRFAQIQGTAVRVADYRAGRRPCRFDSERAGPECRLVRRQLDHGTAAGVNDGTPARHVGLDVEDARKGLGCCHGGPGSESKLCGIGPQDHSRQTAV